MALAALLLPQHLQLAADQFAAVCQANPDAVLELDVSGHVIRMTPTASETGARNSTLLILLGLAVRASGLPLKLFDSSSGFAPLCPDLVVELASPSDEGPRGAAALRRKMELYRRNGAQRGWLLLPAERAVEIWRADREAAPERIAPATHLDAGDLFPGLQIALAEVWQG
jgi:Uma2 family endonuclease